MAESPRARAQHGAARPPLPQARAARFEKNTTKSFRVLQCGRIAAKRPRFFRGLVALAR
jgi:hypothetical protein